MFSLREFIMRGIRGMVGKEPDYKVIEVAAGWLDKGVLAESDLAELDELLTRAEAEYPEPVYEETADTEQTEPAAEDTQEVTENE